MKKYHGNVKCKCGVSFNKHYDLELCKRFIANEGYVKKKSLLTITKTQLILF